MQPQSPWASQPLQMTPGWDRCGGNWAFLSDLLWPLLLAAHIQVVKAAVCPKGGKGLSFVFGRRLAGGLSMCKCLRHPAGQGSEGGSLEPRVHLGPSQTSRRAFSKPGVGEKENFKEASHCSGCGNGCWGRWSPNHPRALSLPSRATPGTKWGTVAEPSQPATDPRKGGCSGIVWAALTLQDMLPFFRVSAQPASKDRNVRICGQEVK